LGGVGGTDSLSTLSKTVNESGEASLRDAAAEAMKAICSRATDKAACAAVVIPALERAKSNAQRVAFIRVLARVANEPALAAVRKGVSDKEAEVADASVRELADWPSTQAAADLLEIAKSSQNKTHAVLAMRGYVRLAASRENPANVRLEMFRNVLANGQVAEKKQALAGIGEVPMLEGLETIQGLLKDPELTADASPAAVKSARMLAAAYTQRALDVLKEVKAAATTDDLKKQVDDAIAYVERAGRESEGFIIAWLAAGPYAQKHTSGSGLFDVVFDPEKTDGKANWRPILAAPNTNPPWVVNLGGIFGGENRVAYLKTQINSEKAQDASLELASDDGIKVWLNGKEIHANNAQRGLQPGEDKVKISLNQGANILLIKVTQNGAGWAACARLRTSEGGKLDGISIKP
jgi:hypothetical protein